VAYALADAESEDGGDGPTTPADTLTSREREVARLVAQGLTNRQVAEQLVLTEKTAANHVGRVFVKLGVHSRSELAARAAELGLTPG
jgi:DNA-binding NarL/FixJ family response regulator